MTGFDDIMRRQQQQIDEYGWAVTAVFPNHNAPGAPFAYTVGLTAHGHPELVIAGLDPRTAQALLNDLAARIYNRALRFTAGQRISDLLAGYDATIVEGPATEALHPGAAFARYGKDKVTLQQVVWPDKQGRFPCQDGYELGEEVQPLLGRP